MTNEQYVAIPMSVLSDERLTPLEKLIFVEICALDQTEKGCFASNQHIANICKCTSRAVSKGVATLRKLGLIDAKTSNGLFRTIKITHEKFSTPHEKFSSPPRKIFQPPTKNFPHSNIDSNIDSNIVSNKGVTHGPINNDNADDGKESWSGNWY